MCMYVCVCLSVSVCVYKIEIHIHTHTCTQEVRAREAVKGLVAGGPDKTERDLVKSVGVLSQDMRHVDERIDALAKAVAKQSGNAAWGAE